MIRSTRRAAGFSLIELLIVLSLIGVLTALVLPDANPTVHQQLESVADVVATDLAFVQSLAVSNNSNYRLTFDLQNNQYTLRHVGTNAALNNLPPSPFFAPGASAAERVVRLAELPLVGPPPRLLAVLAMSASPAHVTSVEFGPLGQTTRSEETVVWLAAGAGSTARYVGVHINPATGLVSVSTLSAENPDPNAAAGESPISPP